MKSKKISIPENWSVSQADSSQIIFKSVLFPNKILFWEYSRDGYNWHIETLSESGRFISGIYTFYKTSKQAIKNINP